MKYIIHLCVHSFQQHGRQGRIMVLSSSVCVVKCASPNRIPISRWAHVSLCITDRAATLGWSWSPKGSKAWENNPSGFKLQAGKAPEHPAMFLWMSQLQLPEVPSRQKAVAGDIWRQRAWVFWDCVTKQIFVHWRWAHLICELPTLSKCLIKQKNSAQCLQCLWMSPHVSKCLPLSPNVSLCLQMSPNVSKCLQCLQKHNHKMRTLEHASLLSSIVQNAMHFTMAKLLSLLQNQSHWLQPEVITCSFATLFMHGKGQIVTKIPTSWTFPILKQLVGIPHFSVQQLEEVWSQKHQTKVGIAACDACRLICCCLTVLLSSQETALPVGIQKSLLPDTFNRPVEQMQRHTSVVAKRVIQVKNQEPCLLVCQPPVWHKCLCIVVICLPEQIVTHHGAFSQ